MEIIINLVEIPQQNDNLKVGYIINKNILTVKLNEIIETFDLNNLDKVLIEDIDIKSLALNPIISIEKNGEHIDIQVLRFYGEDEKELFEI